MKKRAITKHLRRFQNWIFTPPYDGVPWVVWFYVALACACYPHGGVFIGHLSGFDDHVRMTQVLNWINGAGWYDRTIMRANPPEGFTSIWTRIVDIPVAAVVVLAQHFTDQRKAALVAAIVVPFAELALLFPVARYFARPLVGKNKSWLIVLFLMFTTVLNYKNFSIGGFHTGEASHHPWYTILDLALFGAAGRIVLGAHSRHSALIMGGVMGLLLAVGIEGFPMIACASVALAGLAWLDNRPMLARRGAEAMLVGALASLLLLPMHQPPAHLFDISFAEPSMLGPILIATATAFFWFEHFVLMRIGKRKAMSLAITIVAAALLAILLVLAFPQMLDGAAAGLSPAERQMAMAEHYEAMPVHRVMENMNDVIGFLGILMPTIIAVGVGGFAVATASNRRRRALRIAYLGFAAFSGGMAETFSRYMHHAMTTACAWLLWAWDKITARLPRNRNTNLAALVVFVMLGPFWMLLLPALESDAPVVSQVLLFPAKIQTAIDPCDMTYVAEYINEHYSKNTLLIVPNWDSSRFLYYTDVRINFVANYPSQDKFIDNENFFQTQNSALAQAIAQRHGLDLVAVCRLPLVFDPRYPMNKQMMLGLLQSGRPPAWLKQVDISDLPGNYELYRVDKTALGPK